MWNPKYRANWPKNDESCCLLPSNRSGRWTLTGRGIITACIGGAACPAGCCAAMLNGIRSVHVGVLKV